MKKTTKPQNPSTEQADQLLDASALAGALLQALEYTLDKLEESADLLEATTESADEPAKSQIQTLVGELRDLVEHAGVPPELRAEPRPAKKAAKKAPKKAAKKAPKKAAKAEKVAAPKKAAKAVKKAPKKGAKSGR